MIDNSNSADSKSLTIVESSEENSSNSQENIKPHNYEKVKGLDWSICVVKKYIYKIN